jgi:hypothetical protein
MQHTIDINFIKENPGLFFKQLDQNAEQEFISLLEYFIYKYDIRLDYSKEEKNSNSKSVNDFLDFIEHNKLKLPENFKFNRDEANER